MGHPALELAGCWVELGLSIETEISGRALADWYYVELGHLSGGPTSWTWLSHLGGSGFTPSQSTKTLSATWLRGKGKKKGKKKK